LSASASSHRDLSSAVFITNIAESDFRYTQWFADLRAELLSFPAGRHDDQVDALGLVGQLLDKISAGPRSKPPEVTQRDGYRAAFEEMPDELEDDVRRTMTYAPLFALAEQRPRRGVMAQTSTLDNVPIEGV
jgi:hypothetical protein